MKPVVWLLISIATVAIAWLYESRVLLPWENFFYVKTGAFAANLGDLYTPWFGTRSLLREGKNPYGSEVTRDIQTAFYGHPLVQDYAPGTTVIDEQRFAYPLYVVFLLAPTIAMNFAMVHQAAGVVWAIVVLLGVKLWISVAGWRIPAAQWLAVGLFILVSPQVAQGLRWRQLGVIVGFLLALGTWLLVREHLAAAGAVLAFSTIKPQMALLPLAWFLFWSFSDLRRRWRLLAGFGVAWLLLVGACEAILPGWHRDFLAGLAAYRRYGPVTSLLQIFTGSTAGILFGAIAVVALLAWAWRNRRCAATSPEFAIILATFLLAAVLAFPLMMAANQILLILPVLIILRDWERLPKAARAMFALFAVWPWMVSLVLLLFPPQVKSMHMVPLLPSAVALFMPFLLAILLILRRRPTATVSAET
jgi:hypothetical protein